MVKIRCDYRLFSLFCDVIRLPLLSVAEVLLCETIIEQPYYVMKSKMAAPGKFKTENRRKSNPLLSDTKILFSCFPAKYEIRLYFQQFNFNLFQEWRFPLKLKAAL